jgi:glycerol-3-phosphate O-acyltransferase/dihydroxyacetone phosphate acyltransferase
MLSSGSFASISGYSTEQLTILESLLFRFVLKIFYGSIVVEGTHNIPKSGRPCIVSANHSNSLTDAL